MNPNMETIIDNMLARMFEDEDNSADDQVEIGLDAIEDAYLDHDIGYAVMNALMYAVENTPIDEISSFLKSQEFNLTLDDAIRLDAAADK